MTTPLALCKVCHKPALLICSGCRSVAYCEDEHQTRDWSKHKKVCRACKIKKTAEGRFVVATRDMKLGDIIICEIPLLLGPSHLAALPGSCPGCFSYISARTTKARCPRCRWPVCSENCPGLTDQAYHGAECEILTAVSQPIDFRNHSFESLSFLRCLVLQKSDPKKWKALQTMAKQAYAQSGERNIDPAKVYLEDAILNPLASSARHLIPDFSSTTVHGVYSLLDTYGLPLKMPMTGNLVGVSPISSLMEHSCMPNTRLYIEVPTWTSTERNLPRTRIILRAARNIQSGDRLTTCFVNPVLDTINRQKILRSLRNKTCSCARCSDPTELGSNSGTLKCKTCGGWVLPVDTTKIEETKWKCNGKCGSLYPAVHVSNVYSNCVRVIEQFKSRPTTTFELENVLSDLKTMVHPHHFACVYLKSKLCMAYCDYRENCFPDSSTLSDADLHKKAEICRDVLNVMLKPHMRQPANSEFQICLSLFIEAKVEILERKVASGTWDSARADIAKEECCKLFLLSQRINNGFLPKPQSVEQTFNNLKSTLLMMRIHAV